MDITSSIGRHFNRKYFINELVLALFDYQLEELFFMEQRIIELDVREDLSKKIEPFH
jgi:hypothetical protein